MILCIFAACIYALSHAVFVRRVKNRAARLALAAFFCLISFKSPLLALFGGNILAPNLPGWVVVGASGLQYFLLAAIFMGIILEIALGAARLALRRPCPAGLRAGATAAVFLAAAYFAALGTWNAGLPPGVTFYRFRDPSFPEKFRIVQLSDTHIGTNVTPERVRGIVARVNDLEPDLILITGDLIDGAYRFVAPQTDELGGLRAKHGVYAVNGNHEYYSGTDGWSAVWPRLGVRMLENAHAVLTGADGAPILTVAGVTDPAALKRDPGGPAPDFAKAAEGADPSLPLIMMSHRPGYFPESAAAGADITFSGHTHGGMSPVLAQVVSFFNKGYLAGLYEAGGKKLVVSRGTILWAGFYIRLGDPAEIVVADLSRGPADRAGD